MICLHRPVPLYKTPQQRLSWTRLRNTTKDYEKIDEKSDNQLKTNELIKNITASNLQKAIITNISN